MSRSAGTTAFTLDTSGFVQRWVPAHGERHGYAGPARMQWSDLSPFTQGYIEELLRSIGVDRFDALAPETLERIIADCEAFEAAPCATGGSYAGKLFWRARQNPEHAKGATGGNRYWDTVADYPPLTVQLGDDGKVGFAKATGESAS